MVAQRCARVAQARREAFRDHCGLRTVDHVVRDHGDDDREEYPGWRAGANEGSPNETMSRGRVAGRLCPRRRRRNPATGTAAGLSGAARRRPRLRHRDRSRRAARHDALAGTTSSARRGKPQPITQFDNTPQPIRLIVMLDVSGSMEGNLPLLRAGGAQLFARLRPGRRRAGRHVRTRGDDQPVVHAATRASSTRRCRTTIAPDAPTPLWRAHRQAMSAFGEEDDRAGHPRAERRQGHRPLSFRERPSSQAEVIDRARRDDVMIYAVGMRSRSSRRCHGASGRAACRP